MKTLLVPQVALATLALVPNLFAQDSQERTGLVEFTRPAVATVRGTADEPRVRVAQLDQTPKLGVMVSDSDDGVLISEVFDGSLADRAGLAADDILFKIGGKRVNGAGDIGQSLAAADKSQPVSITVIRPGEGLVTLEGKILASAPQPTKLALTAPSGGGFLGVEMGDMSSSGVTISRVIDNSAAWFAGLEGGDVLTAINGKKVTTAEEVAQAIGSQNAGDTVKLSYTRGGATQSSQVRLGRRLPSGLNVQGNVLMEDSPFGRAMQFALPHGDHDQNIFFSQDGAADGDTFVLDLDGATNGHSWVFDHDGEDSDGNIFVIDGEDFDWDDLHENIAEWTDDDGSHQLHLKLDGHNLQGLKELHKLKGLEGLKEMKELKGLIKLKDMKDVQGLHLNHQLKGLDGLNIFKGHNGSTKVLQSIHSDSHGDQNISITIEGGVMTIDRDGEVQVIEIEGDGEVDLGDLGGLENIGFITSDNGIQILGDGATTLAITTSSSASECSEATEECIVVAEACAEAAAEECAEIAEACAEVAEACADAAEECAEVAEACADAAEECCEESEESESDAIN